MVAPHLRVCDSVSTGLLAVRPSFIPLSHVRRRISEI